MRLRRSNKVEKMLVNARGIECFSLDNEFIPDVIEPEYNLTCTHIMKNIFKATKSAYVESNNNGRYTLRVNSNLWYEFSVAGIK